MKVLVIMTTLVAGVVLTRCLPAFAEDRWGLLTPTQERAYHACLYAAWVEDYCRADSHAFAQCVIANGGGKFPLDGRRFTDDYCWYAAHAVTAR